MLDIARMTDNADNRPSVATRRRRIGEQLRTARLQAGLETPTVASEMEVSDATVRRWEAGKTGIHLDRFLDLCEVLEVEASDLLGKAVGW